MANMRASKNRREQKYENQLKRQRVEKSQSDERNDKDADHATPQENLGRVECALRRKQRLA